MARFTEVELVWIEGRIERWIAFGRVAEECHQDRTRRVVLFTPGSVFAFVRWASNGYGTLVSRIDVLRACTPHESSSTVPGVTPGAKILLRVVGWPKVNRTLAAIDDVRATGIAPEDACPDHWRHVGNRIVAGEEPRAYTHERHLAWLLRQGVQG